MSSTKRCRTILPPEPSERRYLRIDEAAQYASTTEWQIRTLIWKRAIPFISIGKRHVLDRLDLDIYLQNQKVAVS